MASISSLGIGSGLDLNGLLDQLQSAERQKLTPIVQQQKSYQSKISAYGKVESALSAFQEAADKLNNADTFRAVTSSVSGEGLTAAAGADAVAGRYAISVTQLAQAHTVAFGGVADKTAAVGSGEATLTISQNGSDHPITIPDGSSLEDIRDLVNAEELGVSASIINDGSDTGYRLVLTSKETGTDSTMALSVTGNTELASLLDAKQEVAAKDAQLTVNGISITSQSNQVEEAIQGVTLNLESEGDSTLTVAQDSETITSDVQAFVDAYNSLQDTLNSMTAYNSGTETAGLLLGDSTTRGIESRLRSVMSSSLAEGSFQMLSDIGIDLEVDGSLKVNDDELSDVIANNPGSLSLFFSGDETTDGFADNIDAVLQPMLEADGTIDNAKSGLESTIDSLNDRYDRVESRINSTIERYRSQFAQMDSLVSQMNSTMSYLAQQFDAMNAQLGQ